jgi:hypothetical protein
LLERAALDELHLVTDLCDVALQRDGRVVIEVDQGLLDDAGGLDGERRLARAVRVTTTRSPSRPRRIHTAIG